MMKKITLSILVRFCYFWPFIKGKGRIQALGLKLLQGSEVTAKCRDGTKFHLSFPDDNGWESLYFQGVFEANTTKIFERLVTKKSIIFDIGANIGCFTMLAGKKIYSGQCHAFEPVPKIYEKLKKNLRLNNLDVKNNIFLNQKALGHVTGTIDIHTFSNLPHGHSSIKKVSEAECTTSKAMMMTLDDYMSEYGIKKIDIIKLDVEGAEMLVLDGGKKIFETPLSLPILIIEMNEDTSNAFGYHPSEVLERISKVGNYEFYRVVQAWHEIKKMSSTSDFKHGDNVFAVPHHKAKEFSLIYQNYK